MQDSGDGSQDGIDSDEPDGIDSAAAHDAAHDATHADQAAGHIACVPVHDGEHAPEPKRAKATSGHAPGVQRTIRSFFAPK